MVWESVLFMAWCALGTFQIAASWARLDGLSFFPRPVLGYIFGAAGIIAAFIWFFSTISIGEEGAKGQHYEQLASVVIGVGSAALATGIVSSIIRCRSFRQREKSETGTGIEVFKDHTFFQLIIQYLKRGRS